MRPSSYSLISLLLLTLLGSGHAQKKDPFQAHLQRAATLYSEQHYQESLAELREAYALYPLPRLQYNLGQVQRKLGHAQEALEAYDLFLRTEPNVPAEQRAEVERHIAELRATLPAPTVPPQEVPPPPPVVTPAPAPAPVLVVTGITAAAPAPRTPLYKRWWLWTAVGVVAAGAVTGIVIGTTYHPAPTIPTNIPFHNETWPQP